MTFLWSSVTKFPLSLAILSRIFSASWILLFNDNHLTESTDYRDFCCKFRLTLMSVFQFAFTWNQQETWPCQGGYDTRPNQCIFPIACQIIKCHRYEPCRPSAQLNKCNIRAILLSKHFQYERVPSYPNHN